MRLRWSEAALLLVTCALPSCVDFGPGGGCDPTDFSTAEFRASFVATERYIVDLSAPVLVARMHVGDRVSLQAMTTTGSFCGVFPSVNWTSTNLPVATVTGTSMMEPLTAVAPGETTVFAEILGKRADLFYLDKPIERIRVVE